MCTGSEQSLDRCPFNGWGSHNCVHFEDAGAVCEGTFMVPRPPPCVHTAKIYIYMYHSLLLTHLLPFLISLNWNNVKNVLNNVPNNLPNNVPNNFSKGKRMRENDRN